jgi:hypothetical protein
MPEQATGKNKPGLSRRDYLRCAAVGTVMSLAGCTASANTPRSIHDLSLTPTPFTGAVTRTLREDGVDLTLKFPHGGCVSGALVTVGRAVPTGTILSVANITPVTCKEETHKQKQSLPGFEAETGLPEYLVEGAVTYPPIEQTTSNDVAYFVYYVPTAGETLQFEKTQYVWETSTFHPTQSHPPTQEQSDFSVNTLYNPRSRFTVYERDGQYLVEYEWRMGADKLHVEFALSKAYHTAVASQRESYYFPTYYENAMSDPFVGAVGRAIVEQNDRLNSEQSQFFGVVRFVQSLTYVRDDEAHNKMEHMKAAIETLRDGTGDCEDTSFLLIGLLSQAPFNYNTALFFPPGHVAVGVDADDIPFSCTRDCVSALVDRTRYIFIESTNITAVGESDFGDSSDFVAIYDGQKWHRLKPEKYAEGLLKNLRTVVEEK